MARLFFKSFPEIINLWPKWRNFAKSGHTNKVLSTFSIKVSFFAHNMETSTVLERSPLSE